jgi:hypothetical protein
MDDLGKLMRNRNFEKPSEVELIVNWCKEMYPSFTVTAQKRPRDYVVTVPNAPLAQEIHMRLVELREAAGLEAKSRIVIKLG